jgi:hypothetical protein
VSGCCPKVVPDGLDRPAGDGNFYEEADLTKVEIKDRHMKFLIPGEILIADEETVVELP